MQYELLKVNALRLGAPDVLIETMNNNTSIVALVSSLSAAENQEALQWLQKMHIMEPTVLNKALSISDSSCVVDSDHISNSINVSNSSKVDMSENIIESINVCVSDNIFSSQVISHSSFVYNSNEILDSTIISKSGWCSDCIWIKDSNDVTESAAISACNHIGNSIFCAGSDDLEHCAFCINTNNISFSIFNEKSDSAFTDYVIGQVREYLSYSIPLEPKPHQLTNTQIEDIRKIVKQLPNYNESIFNICIEKVRNID